MSGIDFKKLSKFSRHAPRYTSYPTAVEFRDLTPEDIIDELKSDKPLSLYFHLPFCRSACYFCGCNVVYTSKADKRRRYIDYLKRELDIWAKYLDTSRMVRQLHFGGGTPTFFTPEELEEIYEIIYSHFKNFEDDAEISVEIDPRFFSQKHMDVMRKYGVNRISFGVQDFNEETQKAVNRIQPFDLTKEAVDIARAAGIDSINVDLIYGLPFQTLETFKKTLELVKELDPDRLAVFNYAHVPWLKKGMRKIDETTLPSPEEKLKIFKYVIDFFENNGYKMVGMDHFAKPDDELFKAIEKGELHRNFQGYTTKGGADLIGFGLTSISETENAYFQNYKDLKNYEKAIDEGKLPTFRGVILNEEDKIRKYVIMEMMANFSFDIKRFEEKFGIDFFKKFENEIKELQEFVDEGLVEITPEKISVNKTGTLLIRNIVLPFDEYFKKMKNQKVFSKSI
ncbi:oxygen-independent coproporphyrinogen III oxidase [Caminibacter pacificus]|uniref:Coproporphyrinogen-III oxidase n=1 Tax=Caminibacter pacificus TaxID=1424653 RepID=A0AAJ4RDJ8_9BACT|nr:oxygen-independent coproporphyrinogen III oxidase [Caminibacter pacificus]QCI28655.1 oxygen-independent coproporphyrinogen III oxidase [Caminibacter pacificus]ROR40616.1 oxygen-independent coproporphyrinogen-3 oxidase [Caminibacter pacificus]